MVVTLMGYSSLVIIYCSREVSEPTPQPSYFTSLRGRDSMS